MGQGANGHITIHWHNKAGDFLLKDHIYHFDRCYKRLTWWGFRNSIIYGRRGRGRGGVEAFGDLVDMLHVTSRTDRR